MQVQNIQCRCSVIAYPISFNAASTSARNAGETSAGWCFNTIWMECSRSEWRTIVSAAATITGDRLIPPPQQTSAGTFASISRLTATIARRNTSCLFPAPSSNGNRWYMSS